MKVLVNDGMHLKGIELLKTAGFEVDTVNIPQDQLPEKLPSYNAICVRSATKVRTELIDQCPNLKVIGRGGVGLDNIDVDYAKSKGIAVVNTPSASSVSVAELAFGHLFSVARFLYKSNQHMPAEGHNEFKSLKKSYAKGFELSGKTLGIIGGGRIGQETAKIALGVGMKVLFVDPFVKNISFELNIHNHTIPVSITPVPMEEMLNQADVITLHIPFTGSAVLNSKEFDQMKDGAILINASRGGTVNEDALLEALDSGKVAAAGIDVYENEPKPRMDLLAHPNVSCSPHIGASTKEAQEKVGIELANQLIELLS
ncbi:MAG: D-2-hydroxyacid dehydrogenase [Saprospiraceae bacterium]|nr:D-2-hydroxyacid dehydrogenase [Saprospiraceae bacterium]NNL91055.1 D-2-hydroxyacid dehydrogenase [Saprospiraceae bacterium]